MLLHHGSGLFLFLNTGDMALKIDPALKALIPPLQPDEYRILEESIKAEGCREKIITWQGCIVDGHNRYEICTKHGIDYATDERFFEDIEAAKVWMIDNQKGRRNLTDGWKFELAQERKKILIEKGRDKYEQTVGRPSKSLSIVDNNLKHNTQKEIASELGWSTGKVAMADRVWKEVDPEIIEKIKEGEVSINQAYKEVRKKEKREDRLRNVEKVKAEIEAETYEPGQTKYDVIVIDPPWAYDEKGGFTTDQYDPESKRGAVDYPTMTIEQIKSIELPDKDSTVMFLWTTHAFLRDSFDILEQWGYTYKATLVWDKEKMGIGRTVRLQVEFCLLGVKGNPVIQGSSERDIIREARREHSRKPDLFYKMVERMTIGRRLDYFAREKRGGFDVYGAETNKF